MEKEKKEKNKIRYERYSQWFSDALKTSFGLALMSIAIIAIVVMIEFYYPGIYIK